MSVENVMKSWGSVFSSSALYTQTNAIGDGIRQCTVGLTTTATITTRDWQASDRVPLQFFLSIFISTPFTLSFSVFFDVLLAPCLTSR